MTTHILIVTHNDVGSALLSAATATLGELPLPTTVIAINYDTNPEDFFPKLKHLAQDLDSKQGLLILTDLYGSTPSNIAASLCDNEQTRMVTGLNLPMLIRLMNYAHLDLVALTEKALSGGQDGIRSI